MRLFTCDACGHTVYFENVRCTQCGHTLAYLPDIERVSAIEPDADDPTLFRALSSTAKKQGQAYRLCRNSLDYGVCNWAVPVEDDNPLCECCRFNDVIPDLSKPQNLVAWHALETSKRRLFRTLHTLELPIESRAERPENGLMFSFKEDAPDGSEKVFTGHNDGEITINVAEADDPFREKLRKQLGEGYRTVLGHFRHEIGHYYWDRLVKDSPWLAACRALFGDETVDYQESVKHHYANPPPSDWPLHYVSSYATMHPWEDWAETWAHYLHMIDTLETARGYGLVLRPKPVGGTAQTALKARNIDFEDFDDLLHGWVPLTVALNSLNRSMGLIDPYPFVLSADVIEKLRFVHDVIEHANASEQIQREVAARWLARHESGEQSKVPQGTDAAESQLDTAESQRQTDDGKMPPESVASEARP